MIMKCLDKDPTVRPESVRAVAQVIDPNLIAQPLFITSPPSRPAAPPGPPTESAPRRRFSAEFYIVMVGLAALLVLAVFTLFLTLRK